MIFDSNLCECPKKPYQMSSILYYPYINVPHNDWTLRTLLYYDHVYSIVPESHFNDPEMNYEPEMLRLVQQELVIPLNPRFALQHYYNLEDPFIRFLSKREGFLSARRNAFKKQLKQIERMGNLYGSRINVGKFKREVFVTLQEMGLAKKNNDEWFWVETHTAGLLMKYLAELISAHLNLLPVTDTYKRRLSIKPREADTHYIKRKKRKKRDQILLELIPYPEQIDVEKLRQFKDRYYQLLENFRNNVELLVFDTNLRINSILFKERLSELNYQKEQLASRMKDSGFSALSYGTVCAAISETANLLVEDPESGTVISVLAGLVALAHSVWKTENPNEPFDTTGMKYMALIDKKIRIQKNELIIP